MKDCSSWCSLNGESCICRFVTLDGLVRSMVGLKRVCVCWFVVIENARYLTKCLCKLF